MNVVVIGGTGHIGRFLIRLLADDDQEVVSISSGRSAIPDDQTRLGRVKFVNMCYPDMLSDGSFLSLLRDNQTDAVIDILQMNTEAVYSDCLQAGVEHLVVCGSVWMFGRPRIVPTPETLQTKCPFEIYRKRYAQMLGMIDQSRRDGFALSAIMPPNICGPGKVPLEGMGGRSIEVHIAHQRGDEVILPFPGTNLIGPCDAEDVARGFFCAAKNRDAAAGEVFNVGSAYALTAEKFIQTYVEIHNTAIPIKYVSPEKYVEDVSPDPGTNFHFVEHMCPDISRISSLLGYRPRYTPEETMERAVKWMIDTGLLPLTRRGSVS